MGDIARGTRPVQSACELGLPRAGESRELARMKLISWNVNGIRAVLKKGFLDFLTAESPDILCLQEHKAGPDLVVPLWANDYTTYWNVAEKKGYAGTVIFTKIKPAQVTFGIG